MGNCLVIEGKEAVKMTRTDGMILEYISSMEVPQVLAEFPGGSHFITDALPVVRHLDPVAANIGPKKKKKEVQQVKAGVVRSVKVVISKQELKEILEREGLTLDDMMMSQVQKKKKKKIPGNCTELDRCVGWKPDLESILEGNDNEGLKRPFTV